MLGNRIQNGFLNVSEFVFAFWVAKGAPKSSVPMPCLAGMHSPIKVEEPQLSGEGPVCMLPGQLEEKLEVRRASSRIQHQQLIGCVCEPPNKPDIEAFFFFMCVSCALDNMFQHSQLCLELAPNGVLL